MGRQDQKFAEVQGSGVASDHYFPRYMKNFNVKGRRKHGTFRLNTKAKQQFESNISYNNMPFAGTSILMRHGWIKPYKFRSD